MTFSFDEISGNVFNSQKLNSSIPFPTRSDALFASVFLKHVDMSMTMFDDLLLLFRQSEFRASDVTMKNAEEILDHIASERRSIAIDRSQKRRQPNGPSASVKSALLAGIFVIEELESQKTPFHAIIRAGDPYCDVGYTLRYMSLAHPSWTAPAQRSLRKRIFVRRSGLRSLLHSPHLGPWVREIDYRPVYRWVRDSRDFVPREANDEDLPRLLCDVLRRCPNVTHLHMQDLYPNPGRSLSTTTIPAARTIIRQLRKMKNLEHLWLHRTTQETLIKLWEVCAILPGLHMLKSLSLENMRSLDSNVSDNIHDITPPTMEEHPSPTLETLALLCMPDTASDNQALVWLTTPRAGYVPKNLELTVEQTRHLPHANSVLPLSYLVPAFPNIAKLQIEYNGAASEHGYNMLLASMPSLHSLRLCMSYLGKLSEDRPLVLPSSIETFHIHLHCHPEVAPKTNVVVSMLKSSPHVRSLRVTFSQIDIEVHNTPILRMDEILGAFANVIEYCAENDVTFDFWEMPHDPIITDD